MASIQLHVKPEFNYEEAAHAASDIVGNLENLPGEVSFLLAEIREKDQRIDALLQRIHQRHYGLTKHVAKLPNASSSSSNPSPTLPVPPGNPLPTDHLTQKESQTIQKIQSEWEKIEILQEEKVKLADRMKRIVSRARERARAEWVKVGGIDIGELSESGSAPGGGWEGGNGAEIVLPPGGLGSGSDIRQKKRKPQALPLPLPSSYNPIIHPSSSMPPPPPPSGQSARRTHPPPHTTQSQSQKSSRSTSRHKSMSIDEQDVDAEGEYEVDESIQEIEAEDDTIYCTCGQQSHGEMIGCDNDNCPIQWYHTECVKLKEPLPDTWFCPKCVVSLGLSSSAGNDKRSQKDKKGRKR